MNGYRRQYRSTPRPEAIRGMAILRIDVHFMCIPQDNFIARVTGQVQHLCTLVRMAVIREQHNSVTVTIQHTAIFDVAVQ